MKIPQNPAPSPPRSRPATPAVQPATTEGTPFSLRGRVALVTGSSRGLGKAIAQALGRAGAAVAHNYKNDGELAERSFAEYREQGCEGGLFRADVTSPDEVADLCKAIAGELGAIDILVPNATPAQPLKPFEDYDWAFHQQMLDFFVKSPFLLLREVLPHLKQQRWGRIVNICSEVFRQGVPHFSPYVAAKGAQIGWSRSMARELAPWNVTVNMVSPGWIPVERHANDPQEAKDRYLAQIPMGRWGVPADVAGTVTFLCSEQASFVTGQDIAVNGGTTVW